jgi:hypothetical protein
MPFVDVDHQPMKEFPPDQRQVRPDRDCRNEARREKLRVSVRHPFEQPILQPREHSGDTHLRFVSSVITAMDGASNRAPLAAFPIEALDDLIGRLVREHLIELRLLELRQAVKCEHGDIS